MSKIPFSRSVESWHAYPYSTCRQVEISFLGMPQIAHFQVEIWKSSLAWEGGHPPPTPSLRSVATLLRAWSLRSLAKIVPPPQFVGSLRHCRMPPHRLPFQAYNNYFLKRRPPGRPPARWRDQIERDMGVPLKEAEHQAQWRPEWRRIPSRRVKGHTVLCSKVKS